MPLREPVYRLEEALQLWEEETFFMDLVVDMGQRAQGIQQGLPKAIRTTNADFREFLLGVYGSNKGRNLTDCPFIRSTENDRGDVILTFNLFIESLVAWTAKSRRVYKLPRDMQYLLANTALVGISWEMVKMPFEAFALCTEEAVPCGDKSYDCFIVSHGEEGAIRIMGLGPNKDSWKSIGDRELRKITDLYRGRRWRKCFEAIEERYASKRTSRPHMVFWGAEFTSTLIEDTTPVFVAELQRVGHTVDIDRASHSQPIFRLVAGLCLYLTSLPGTVTEVGRVQPIEASIGIDRTAVTSGAEVTTVANFFTLQAEKDELLHTVDVSRRGEVCCHWRSGYWRRPRGTGHIPDAPRTEWIRPTLVRQDRLPENGIPAGTKTTVKKPPNS